MNFVVDASVTLTWCFEDQASHGEQLLDRLSAIAGVPATWPFELFNRFASLASPGPEIEPTLDAVHVGVMAHFDIG